MHAKVTRRKRPFFVYGTLIPGQANDHYWEESIVRWEPAHFSNGCLYDMGHYPALVEGGPRRIKGALITIDNRSYSSVVRRLDKLEGYDPRHRVVCAYRRLLRKVVPNQGEPTLAWVYIGQPWLVSGRPSIESDSWPQFVVGRQADLSDWWQGVDGGRGEHLPYLPGNEKGQASER